MMGDHLTYTYVFRAITTTTTTSTSSGTSTSTSTSLVPVRVVAAARAGSAFKIAENENVLPTDRVFVNYNYFNNIRSFGEPSVGGTDLHRQTFGFEKTCLDGCASVGVRVPIFQSSSTDALNANDFGNVSAILKVAVCRNCDTGSGLSLGLVVTAPTGPDIVLLDGHKLDSVLLQPFVGFVCNKGSCFVHGFSSVVIPTDPRDLTFMSNDVGIGYRLFQAENCNGESGLLTSVIPTVEVHVNTPLDHRGLGSLTDIAYTDNVVCTGGCHFGLGGKCRLSLGAATCVTGPRLFDVEGFCQFNMGW